MSRFRQFNTVFDVTWTKWLEAIRPVFGWNGLPMATHMGELRSNEQQHQRTRAGQYIHKQIVSSKDSGWDKVKVSINFTGLLISSSEAYVWVWHDTADDCGDLCDANVKFLREVATIEVKQPASSKIKVRPRFIFQNCTKPGSEFCSKSCTASDRCVPPRV